MPFVSSNRRGNSISTHVNRRIPRNSAALSRSVEIIVAGIVVGYVQNMDANEGRELTDIREVGNEEVVEIAPGGPKDQTLALQRVMLYHSRLHQIMDEFGNHGNFNVGIRSLMDFNVPLDVVVMIRRNTEDNVTAGSYDSDLLTGPGNLTETKVEAGQTQELVVLDWFHECWPESNKYTVKAEPNFTIMENLNLRYTWRTGSPLYVAREDVSNISGVGQGTTIPAFAQA